MNKHRGSSIDEFMKAPQTHYFGPPDNPSLIVGEHDSGVFISSLKPAFYDAAELQKLIRALMDARRNLLR